MAYILLKNRTIKFAYKGTKYHAFQLSYQQMTEILLGSLELPRSQPFWWAFTWKEPAVSSEVVGEMGALFLS